MTSTCTFIAVFFPRANVSRAVNICRHVFPRHYLISCGNEPTVVYACFASQISIPFIIYLLLLILLVLVWIWINTNFSYCCLQSSDRAYVLCFVEFSDAKCAITAMEALQGYSGVIDLSHWYSLDSFSYILAESVC